MGRVRKEITDYLNRLKSFSKNSKLFLGSYALVRIGWGIFRVIFNLYILELGYSGGFLGALISTNLVASALFLFPGGAISDRIGRQKTLLIATILMSGSILTLATMQERYLLLLANGVRGISRSLFRTTVAPLMMEQSDDYERMHLFSVTAALRSFSAMIGNLLGGFLPPLFAAIIVGGLSVQYQFTWGMAGALILVASIPLIFIKEGKKIRKKVQISPQKLFSGKRSFVLQFTLCSIIIGLGAGIIVPYFNVYFSEVLHATSGQIGMMFSAGALTMTIASLILPLSVRRLGRVRSTVLTRYLSIPFLLLMMIAVTLPVAFIGYFMRMTLMNVSHPAQRNFYMDHIVAHERGKANGVAQFGATIFRAAGSKIGGFLIDTGNFSRAFQFTAVMYTVGTSVFYSFFRKKE